jgi:hypothetical protein
MEHLELKQQYGNKPYKNHMHANRYKTEKSNDGKRILTFILVMKISKM